MEAIAKKRMWTTERISENSEKNRLKSKGKKLLREYSQTNIFKNIRVLIYCRQQKQRVSKIGDRFKNSFNWDTLKLTPSH